LGANAGNGSHVVRLVVGRVHEFSHLLSGISSGLATAKVLWFRKQPNLAKAVSFQELRKYRLAARRWGPVEIRLLDSGETEDRNEAITDDPPNPRS